ncbi:secretion-regulating guanine nucleotide exchange factor isoform X2 [Neodiprion lecontei]|uniref:Secretion-regulating guanine nucleotide exchange factor isoform X2 n=1 Tax=Neodiprion lecontei TaxID=441921 RepID=A0ABM3FEM2_NEOLC|nr:secretion-regulating guanine nucleotide exchange factor isoform X2 [Neodiprion lecontei]
MKTFHLLSWGANSHRQLGHDVESEQCLIPTAVNLNDPCGRGPRVSDITKMSGGAGHSLILNRQGEVYSCGLNNKHQAGAAGTRKYVESLVKIDALKEATVVDIACGWDSSMAVDDRGQLYAWGSNAYGQLGAGKTPSQKPAIIHLKETAPDPVADIAMGLRHSALVTTSGNVLVAGYGSKCQLGIIDESNKSLKATDTFTQVPGLTGIKSVACGQHHTIALSKNGDLYAWGDNKHGQLGFDPKIYARLETPLKLENVNVGPDGKIFTGWTHTAVLHGRFCTSSSWQSSSLRRHRSTIRILREDPITSTRHQARTATSSRKSSRNSRKSCCKSPRNRFSAIKTKISTHHFHGV